MKILALSCVAVFGCSVASAQAPAKPLPHPEARAVHKAASAERQLQVTTKPWTGDFDGMLERRMIRVAAPYSRSLFYIDKGRERGIGAELVRDFEQWINKKYA